MGLTGRRCARPTSTATWIVMTWTRAARATGTRLFTGREFRLALDQGSPTADLFIQLCAGLGIRQSMGPVGLCFIDAAAEALHPPPCVSGLTTDHDDPWDASRSFARYQSG